MSAPLDAATLSYYIESGCDLRSRANFVARVARLIRDRRKAAFFNPGGRWASCGIISDNNICKNVANMSVVFM